MNSFPAAFVNRLRACAPSSLLFSLFCMKRYLLPLLLVSAVVLPTFRAQAQDNKPVLNTAPPGPPPAPVRTTPPPTPVPAATTPEPTTAPLPEPTTAPDPNAPSGLELPGREKERKAAQQHAEQNTKFFIYSGFGIGYSSNVYYDGGALNLSLSPALGYRINDRIAVGPGISYAYTNQTFGKGNPTLSLNNIGVKGFVQIQVIDQFFVHGEYEVTKAELPLVDINNNYIVSNNKILTGSRTVESPLAGVGYRSLISNRVAADILVLYNFNSTFNNSIYGNPVIRFNFLFNIGK